MNDIIKNSESGQEQFVLKHTNYKNNGYFVDIGAADGITASNSFTLEKWFKWDGICVDPNPAFLQSLMNCRDNFVSTLCVYSESGKILPFRFIADQSLPYGLNFKAGLSQYNNSYHPSIDEKYKTINVYTISLIDLLILYQAPKQIDYLSLDTEGSEYEILRTFDFDRYSISCITVEHANNPLRESIIELLESKGYVRAESEQPYNEDWFYKK